MKPTDDPEARLTPEEIEYCDLDNPYTCRHCMERTVKAVLKKLKRLGYTR